MGEYYFTAQNGTVTSSEALSNPYNGSVNVDNLPFLEVDYLSNVITDQHYDDPERKGRHVVFISRILTDYGAPAFGIAVMSIRLFVLIKTETLGPSVSFQIMMITHIFYR